MKTFFRPLFVTLLLGIAFSAGANVTPNPLFADNAILQQGMNVPIWGTADPDEHVTVEFAGQTVSATTGKDGRWLVRLAPLTAGGPFTLTISGKNKITLANVLVGEVWICSGQSNMERHLGLQSGQKPIVDWEREVREANHPEIRQFYVVKKTSFTPETTVNGGWSICSTQTVKDFTAVGYFFGRDLQAARKVPIGLIHSSWGGTPAEAWTSEAGLRTLPSFAATLTELKQLMADPDGGERSYQARLEKWFQANDPGSAPNTIWSARDVDTASWKEMKVPGLWEYAGEPDLDGVVWLRKTFELPKISADTAADLELGMIDDMDTTWVNGTQVGAKNGYNLTRKYSVAPGILKPGRNVIAVRVLDTGGGGGIWGDLPLRLILKGGTTADPINLAGAWQYRVGLNLKNAPFPPMSIGRNASAPTVLYNAMIAPLLPYAMRGVIWYQGEANVGRERQYRDLFPAMIADWRQAWGEGDFPFLFVQIAPFNSMTPEIREAQLLTWQRTKNTAMVVTIDCGDANDIHPANKQPVGARLALAARALAYGEKIEYSGPVFDQMTVDGTNAVLHFAHTDGRMYATSGSESGRTRFIKGFTIAGADKVFHPAQAEVSVGDAVVVHSGMVSSPVAVRYGWANVPEGNLRNHSDLPASPFRTDVD